MELLRPDEFPGICQLVQLIDDYLRNRYPAYFGENPSHPFLPVKRSKVIHDNLWGTNAFTWQELAIIDSPILQRLREIHQTGLAYQVYPSASHTRFEHSLGVATVASRIFDSVLQRQGGKFRDIVKAATADAPSRRQLPEAIAQLRLELRLAALLHDTGHSLFSHSSEQVFEHLSVVSAASEELARIVGKRKGAGESIAFAITVSNSVKNLLQRASSNLSPSDENDGYAGAVDMLNVALMIVGRTRHPFLQFLADIISSGFDADKLDYLLRDATSAGLPLNYDFERYFYAVSLEDDRIADGEGELNCLYERTCTVAPERRQPVGTIKYEYYDTYRLRLPSKAMNTIEQIVICKLMLFSYIYHHPKVRAAEGLLVDILEFCVSQWRDKGESDDVIFRRFLDMTDNVISHPNQMTDGLSAGPKEHIEDALQRLRYRTLPREVYRIGGAVASGAERTLLADFLTSLQDRTKRDELLANLTRAVADDLIATNQFGGSPQEVTRRVGLRIDVPKPPKFEDVDELVLKGSHGAADIQLLQVFPISQWTHAYTHYRYYARIFCYSEFVDAVAASAKKAMQSLVGIEASDFYKKISRHRSM